MDTVVLVEHLRIDDDGSEHLKTVGVYRGVEAARAAVERLKSQPGFRDYPRIVTDASESGFILSTYPLDKDHWVEGFG